MSSGHGGKRNGAGRKAGSVTTKTRETAEKAAAEGLTPLDYMLGILRNENEPKADRMWAAEKAAPYVHAKLASVEHKGDGGGPLELVTKIELVALEPTSGDSQD